MNRFSHGGAVSGRPFAKAVNHEEAAIAGLAKRSGSITNCIVLSPCQRMRGEPSLQNRTTIARVRFSGYMADALLTRSTFFSPPVNDLSGRFYRFVCFVYQSSIVYSLAFERDGQSQHEIKLILDCFMSPLDRLSP